MVSAVDELLGNLTAALKRAAMWQNSVFVVSGDNGGWVGYGGLNSPYRGHKTTLWEGGVRAIGIVVAPGQLKAPGVSYKGSARSSNAHASCYAARFALDASNTGRVTSSISRNPLPTHARTRACLHATRSDVTLLRHSHATLSHATISHARAVSSTSQTFFRHLSPPLEVTCASWARALKASMGCRSGRRYHPQAPSQQAPSRRAPS